MAQLNQLKIIYSPFKETFDVINRALRKCEMIFIDISLHLKSARGHDVVLVGIAAVLVSISYRSETD